MNLDLQKLSIDTLHEMCSELDLLDDERLGLKGFNWLKSFKEEDDFRSGCSMLEEHPAVYDICSTKNLLNFYKLVDLQNQLFAKCREFIDASEIFVFNIEVASLCEQEVRLTYITKTRLIELLEKA